MYASTVFKRTAISMLFFAAVAGNANAASKTVSVKALQTLVAGLGLEDTGDKTSYVSIDDQGPRKLSITLRPVDSDAFMQMYVRLGDISKEKMSGLPSKKMLEYNDNHAFYFTIGGSDDNLLYLQARLSAATITPQLIRQQIDEIEAAADETADLWDTDKWQDNKVSGSQAPAGNAALEVTATLVADERSSRDDIHKRPDQKFKVDEPFILYIQPSHFTTVKEGETFKANFSVDMQVIFNGEVVANQPGLMKQDFNSAEPIKFVGLHITDKITGLIPGDFTLKIKVDDLIGHKSADATVPVTMIK